MASLDVIRSLTIRAKTEGFDKAKSDVEGLGTSYEDSARRQLSMAKSLEQLERRFVSGAREQQEFAKVQRQVNMILAQNPALQDRANKVLEEAHGRLSKATESTGGFNKALVAANDNLVGFASRLGTVGPLLVALGPAGIAASAALVALTLGLKGAADAALKLSETAGKLKDLSETTGFTVVQLQALEQAGAQVGLSAEKVTGSLERFAVQFDELKTASGDLYKSLRQISPALADQASKADSLASAWDLVSQAYIKADTSQRAVLSRQIFGRGGIGSGRLLGATFEAGGLSGLVDGLKEIDRITQQQAEHWDQLGDSIRENLKIAEQNIVSTFAGPMLENMNKFSTTLREISQLVKSTDWTSGWTAAFGNLVEWLAKVNPLLAAFVIVPIVARSDRRGAAAPAAGPSRFDQVFGDLEQVQGAADRMKALMKAAQDQKDAVIQAANKSREWIQVLGSGATPAERLKDQILQLNAQVARGAITADQAREATGRLNAEFQHQRIQDTVAALGDAATEAEKYAARVDALKQKLDQGTISQETFNRAVAALDPTMVKLQSTVTEIGSALAQAFIQGKDGVEALNASLKAVAATAAGEAFKNLIKGDIASGAVGGTVAVKLELFNSVRGKTCAQNKKDHSGESHEATDNVSDQGDRRCAEQGLALLDNRLAA